jgi:hypothetical protein
MLKNDRRTRGRVELPTPLYVELFVTSQQSVPGDLFDVSPSGIGILVDSANPFAIDSELEFECQGVRFSGTVAHVGEAAGSRFRIGISWAERLQKS